MQDLVENPPPIIDSTVHKVRSGINYYRQKNRPDWIDHPTNLQIDTHNYCNLWLDPGCTGCIYCNVKPGAGWEIPRGYMPSTMIEDLVEYWGPRKMKSVAPYIDGEPGMDPRLPWIGDIAQEQGMYVVIDTNGAVEDLTKYKLYDDLLENDQLFDDRDDLSNARENIIHPNMKEVRFSFSANSPEVYEINHGGPYFDRVTEHIEYFLENKHEDQIARLYFITNKHNLDEIDDYIEKWERRAWITLFPLHEVPDIQLSSEKTKPSAQNYWNRITKRLTGKKPEMPYRPIDIRLDGSKRSRTFRPWITCQGTHSFSVAWTGELLHCTDIPYEYNYGHVYDENGEVRDLISVWKERNRNKYSHEACQKCNVRNPDHNKILLRYNDVWV